MGTRRSGPFFLAVFGIGCQNRGNAREREWEWERERERGEQQREVPA